MKFRSLLAALLLTVLHNPAHAAFANLGILGDSLSDTGRLAQATAGATFGLFSVPNEPYFPGRFSNGSVWVDYYAAAHPGIVIGNAAMGGGRCGGVSAKATEAASADARRHVVRVIVDVPRVDQ